MIEHEINLIPLDQIQVDPERESRRKINPDKVSELALSIKEVGLIHPILVQQDSLLLIVGGHRLAAYKQLNETGTDWNSIPVHFAFNVTNEELLTLELEENIKRNDMTWKEITLAIMRVHDSWLVLDPHWTAENTAKRLSLSSPTVSMYLRVARELSSGNDRLSAAAGVHAARNILERLDDRAIANEMDILGETEAEIDHTSGPDPQPSVENFSSDSSFIPPAPVPSASILCVNFNSWVQSYSGPRFNLIHCDFPFGVNHHKSEQGRSTDWGQYSDTEETYWDLCNDLVVALPKIAASSCHIMFWFSMNYYEETRAFFETAGLTVQPFPLIWHKSDGKGILPDPQRGPRRIYETAFLMSLGDRKVVTPVTNLYAAPGKKELHLSEKSESMLRHFFRMLVDEHTILLDPTCGSGTAIRAGIGLKAKSCLGLELDPECAEDADLALRQAIYLIKASEARHGN